MIEVSDSTEFNRLIEALSQHIVNAAIYYKLFKNLQNDLDNHPGVNNQSPKYWFLTVHSLHTTSLMALCRAYDQEDKGLHIKSWLKTIQENAHLFDEFHFRERLKGNPYVDSLADNAERPEPSILISDLESCSPSDLEVKTLLIHRGNLIAHRNAKNVVNITDIAAEYPLYSSQIEELIERAVKILNRYGGMFNANTFSTQMVGEDDYKFVIDSVDFRVKCIRKQVEELLTPRDS
jgi:hypothetical protein